MNRKALTVIVMIMIAMAGVAAAETAEPAAASSAGVVNVNTAGLTELQLLPRIGPALAGRIVEFREANGPFKSTDELVAVKGIGERSLANLKPYVAVKGETTLKTKVRKPKTQGGEAK